MPFGREVAFQRADKADGQEDRADDHVEPVKAGRHEEGRAIDVAGKAEGRVAVFIGLKHGEDRAQADGQDQPVDHDPCGCFRAPAHGAPRWRRRPNTAGSAC